MNPSGTVTAGGGRLLHDLPCRWATGYGQRAHRLAAGLILRKAQETRASKRSNPLLTAGTCDAQNDHPKFRPKTNDVSTKKHDAQTMDTIRPLESNTKCND
jgi:hypothetical protein